MKCPFSALQAAGIGQCSKAVEVVRRGGSEYDCSNAENWRQCVDLQQHLLALGLAALAQVDDLSVTPKSVYDRVLLGGLRGVGELLPERSRPTIESDISALVEAAAARYPKPQQLPPETIVRSVEETRPPRRRNTRR